MDYADRKLRFAKQQESIVKKLLAAFVILGTLVGAATYYRSANPRAPQYPTDRVVYGPIAEVIRGTGLIEVRDPVVVTSAGLGVVEEIAHDADFGKTVKKGQKLLQLDDEKDKLRVEQANALVEFASRERDAAHAAADAARRIVELMKQNPNSYGQVERNKAEAELAAFDQKRKGAEAKLEEAKVGVKGAEYAKSLTVLEAPVDGVIIDRKVVKGQGVGPQLTTPLFVIAPSMAEMRVLAQISQTDIARITAGQMASISMFTSGERQPERSAVVKETRLAPTQIPGVPGVPGTVSYSAVLDVPNKRMAKGGGAEEWELRHGMTADVTIYLRSPETAFKVPKEAVDLDLEPKYISSRAKARLDQWNALDPSREAWKRIWMLENGEPWPVFIRVINANGVKAIEDDQFTQFYEWDWGENVKRPLDAATVDALPPVIVNKPETSLGAIDRLLKSFKPTG